MARVRVTGIVIFFDEELHLGEAVESVLAQSLADWELLLVDDGSRDGSRELATEWTRRDPRIRLLSHEGRANRGMSASRNLGLVHAEGELVGFLDADDVWMPEKLVEQVALLDREPEAALVYGRTLIWSSGSGGRDFCYDLGVAPDRLYRPPVLLELLLRNQAQTPTTCNALLRRSLVGQIGGFEDSFRGMFEDQVFFGKALLRAPAYVADNLWARYRQRPESASARSAAAGADEEARRRFLEWVGAHLGPEMAKHPSAVRVFRREVRLNRIARWRRALKRRLGRAGGA